MTSKKISEYDDGGQFALGDKFLIARSGENYTIDGGILPTLANVAANSNAVTALASNATTLTSRVSNLASNATTLTNRVSNLASNAVTLTTRVGQIETDFSFLPTVAHTGAYGDLSGKPSIPSKTSDLTNDSGYLTTVAIPNTGVTAGTYTNATITVGADGRITSISSGTAGTGTTPTATAFPRAAQFTDYSVFGRGSSGNPPTLTNSGSDGLTLTDNNADVGFKSALRPIPTAPSAGSPFEFIANISVAEGNAQYGIDGLAIADAAGNIQFWGVNGGNSSNREGHGNASYNSNGSFQDGEYDLGPKTDGSWFRIVVSDTKMFLYRGADGSTWSLKTTYDLPGRGFGAITRYGFMTHRYASGTGDVLSISKAYSTEFPKT